MLKRKTEKILRRRNFFPLLLDMTLFSVGGFNTSGLGAVVWMTVGSILDQRRKCLATLGLPSELILLLPLVSFSFNSLWAFLWDTLVQQKRPEVILIKIIVESLSFRVGQMWIPILILPSSCPWDSGHFL